MRPMLILPLLALTAAAPATKPKTPADVLAAAPAAAWKTIPAEDLMVIDLAGGTRVVVQLAPAFAPVHVANIRAFARSGWWNGGKAAIYRVQDNYVVQWGRNETEDPMPPGVVKLPPAEYHRRLKGLTVRPLGYPDQYAPRAGFALGWPIAYDPKAGTANLTHCYAYVGVARDLSPDTGNGSELYAIIGHAPRALDRVIAVVGRIVSGMETMSAFPRGTEALGIYKDRAQDIKIGSVQMASDLPAGQRPSFQYLDTQSASFAEYVRVRASRKDAFFIRSAGGVDLCSAGVPTRATPAG
ncbi:MAG: peptidylprolyl isomerase [Pseudomonadota bacterium]|nr:peptidylprolyl isomerase [Sphingomonas sp.]MDQ3478658.1 peptidylprolyl isomerase [Pseudomonadota bacterium]